MSRRALGSEATRATRTMQPILSFEESFMGEGEIMQNQTRSMERSFPDVGCFGSPLEVITAVDPL